MTKPTTLAGNDANSLAECLLAAIDRRPGAWMVGVAGVPGSGKTTLCRAIRARREDAVIVPMDGYHLPRSRLDAEGLRRRGALHTIDGEAFRADMETLRRTHRGIFPAFDHAEKDPRPGAILVAPDDPLVIVEGIYVLMAPWRAEGFFDLRVFLDCDLDEAVRRLAVRHVETGLASTALEGHHRAVTNDRVNAEVILADGCRERADLVLRAGDGRFMNLLK
jgi:pantothenate kinase